MQVCQVLDLGDRQQAGEPGAEREPEYRLLVEQGVEDPGGPEPSLQPPGDAVHAALAADVLTEDQQFGVQGEEVGEGQVDRERQREGTFVLGQSLVEDPGTRGGFGRAHGLRRDPVGVTGRERRQHRLRRG